jgi:hypothetical protein
MNYEYGKLQLLLRNEEEAQAKKNVHLCRIYVELPDWSAVSRLKNPFFFRENTELFLHPRVL